MGVLFGGAPSPPQAAAPPTPPLLPEPTVMPVPDPEAQKRAEIKKLAVARARVTTRNATILGNDGDTLG